MDANLLTTLLLTRHGQSTWNADGRWQGQADPPLSDYGRHQARLAAAHIGMPDAIVSSPQQRALETAAIIAELLGVGPVMVHDDLRERSAGLWSGLTHAEIMDQFPGWLDTDRRPDGYESDAAVLGRVEPVLRAVASEYHGATVLVVCHGGIIRALETAAGLDEGRIPNLAGRVAAFGPGGAFGPGASFDPRVEVDAPMTEARLRLGERIRFIEEPAVASGGGDSHRL